MDEKAHDLALDLEFTNELPMGERARPQVLPEIKSSRVNTLRGLPINILYDLLLLGTLDEHVCKRF